MDLLQEVKDRLIITGNFHDKLLTGYIEDVKQFLISGGVKKSIVESEKSIGCIAKGVSDLWINNVFSETFKMRVVQLTFEVEDVQTEESV